MFLKPFFATVALLFCFSVTGSAQKNKSAKYPSLLWEITGNGLKKPSYLFGTMHVSNKMAFHLSDSFYNALKSVDAVALELNPDLWQGQMITVEKMKNAYGEYISSAGGDYVVERTFRINKYEDQLKLAIRSEPAVVNNLLYRSYKAKEDFEEDTFLDLYIFQTGKKLGKRATGVEDFLEAEKIVIEAYTDMAKEKKRREIDTDGESFGEIQQKIQDAYRRGDLDLMDSLDIMIERSTAFREKFLYKRNDIQAASIDTILKKSSLFVGVGAAHLPGKRGVIEILRKMGYTLRPIKMADRDAQQKEAIDKLTVPVRFAPYRSPDGRFSVDVPGQLYEMDNDYQPLDRLQYSDMSNGAYYLITRIKTHAAFVGHTEDQVLKKIDSMLYDNIPGKILSRTPLSRNGYRGFDIVNKTRRGDVQRYHFYVSPFDILIFKMSGKEGYVQGSEADRFFSSIALQPQGETPVSFTPPQGGFTVSLPQMPVASTNIAGSRDGRWEYEAVDKTSGAAYLIIRKSLYNFDFLDQDSFDLAMIEESFRAPDYFDKQVRRKMSSFNGFPCLDVTEKMKDGSEVHARYLIKGPHYYVLAMRSTSKKQNPDAFFSSFRFVPYRYAKPSVYADTALRFSVATPIKPDIDPEYRALIEKAKKEAESGNNNRYASFWPKEMRALFKSDSTGEVMGVGVQEYPRYFYIRDRSRFWENELSDYYAKTSMAIHGKIPIAISGDTIGYTFHLRDTGSSRVIHRTLVRDGNYMFSLVTMGDTLNHQSDFINQFISSFKPIKDSTGKSFFDNKLDSFFADLFSKDSAVQVRAQQQLASIYYGEKGVPYLVDAINRIKKGDRDYFAVKSKLIAELGYIRDTVYHQVVPSLKKIFEQTADTSLFQNQVFIALARHQTKESYDLLRTLLLQDPPVFDDRYDYGAMFNQMEDTLKLARSLFPDLMQLASLDDYKPKVLSLLVSLADSGYIEAKDYETDFSKIYFDAKIELKKLQGKDEKRMEEESRKGKEEEDTEYNESYRSRSSDNDDLEQYVVLLLPFYDKNPGVQKFFTRLLQSKDPFVRMNTAVSLLRSGKTVPDSVLTQLAAEDQFRARLFYRMKKNKLLAKFPAKYNNPLDLARSNLVLDKDLEKMDSIVYISKQKVFTGKKSGFVYFFKYRIKKTDDWKIGLSGLQPENEKEADDDDTFASMTDKKLKTDEPINEQFNKLLKKIIFGKHDSGENFFNGDRSYRTVVDDDE
jgi:uncharacterized protein YbaP (TraB family)